MLILIVALTEVMVGPRGCQLKSNIYINKSNYEEIMSLKEVMYRKPAGIVTLLNMTVWVGLGNRFNGHPGQYLAAILGLCMRAEISVSNIFLI